MSTGSRLLITSEDVPGHKILKCYNKKTWNWYVGEAEVIVPGGSTIVHPKRYYYDKDIGKMYEIPNDELRTNKIKVTHIKKQNGDDECIPLYYGLMHNNRILYVEGENYETSVDVDVEKEASNGFHFKLTKEAFAEDMDRGREQVLDYNLRNIYFQDI
jgi:hypothetical protein